MTGRARGRARGRGRATAKPPAAEAPSMERRPGEPAPPPMQQAAPPQEAAGGMPVPGRGRSRGGTTQPGPGAIPKQEGPMHDMPSQMAKLAIGASGEGGVGGVVPERRGRRGDEEIEPRTRPENFNKKAMSGQAIPLYANGFKLKTRPNWQLHLYRVDFDPQILNPRARFALLKHHQELLGREFTLDMDTMYSIVKLAEKVTNLTSERNDGSTANIKVTHVSTLNPMAPNTLHLYNVIFRRVLKIIKMEQVGRNYYDPKAAIDVKAHGLQLWPGFVTSVLQYEYDVLLMSDVSHKVLRTQTVLDVMYNIMDRSRGRFREEINKSLIGEIVLTKYNNKTYRIDDIDFNTTPQDTFETRSGPVTYVDYFKKSHDRVLTDLKQPMLISNPKKREAKKGIGPALLPPELCFLTGLSDEIRSNFSIMKDLATHTRIGPKERCQELTKFIRKIDNDTTAKSYLRDWGMEFDDQPVKFSGRVLPPEKLFQKLKQFSYSPNNADWSRDSRGNALTDAKLLRNWKIFFTRKDSNRGQDFINTLGRVANPMGMNMAKPSIVELRDDRTETYTQSLKEEYSPHTQIVVVIVPSNRKDRYDAIKKTCVLTHPVPSQVIVTRTISKQQMLMSVATKIALQMNCKMGGDLWRVEIPLNNLMVIGIDSYHDSLSKGRSVMGFVASMNQSLTSFYSCCAFQHTSGEFGTNLATLMNSSLKRYYEINKMFPDRIIIYRDGVGDGQVNLVVDYEIPQIKTVLDKVYPQGTVHKLGVVVVKKRINNRFFADLKGGLSNPPPGTVVDDVVTKPQLYDFFIISQSVRQGTVSPTSYNVVYDTTGLKPDHMQRLTYKLTHLYFNWPGTVRVPAPCMYAHKLAFLIGQSVHDTPSADLADTLFYL
ncbi:piwi-like protein 1 [Lytechinus variegatus]|uniref:piwi-like protein 1 n=1 Tax=Lytechinus variegatus TaxID=7654 RepID=UPI001BB0E43E|nr:piwi-like protein 1 [Lytechinus variegatus]XP_041456324.1 piwi-like protein 1 [Lytechinus variegatus]XP_041456325.1 piwi-like protein 1 [Lytechinus variegatus]